MNDKENKTHEEELKELGILNFEKKINILLSRVTRMEIV